MNPDDALTFEVSGGTHAQLDQDHPQLSHRSRNDFPANHAHRGGVSGGVEMAVKAIRRSRSHWKRADEIHERQLVQGSAARALAGVSFRRSPFLLVRIKVNRLVVVCQRIPLVLKEAER